MSDIEYIFTVAADVLDFNNNAFLEYGDKQWRFM